ncbi:transcriptional regulator SplA domain-containing protein [Paenibacillus sp. CAU 1782]
MSQENKSYRPGDVVYVLYRNPHAQDVANVQAAAVVSSPQSPDELALFLHDTFYEMSDELAVFPSERDAEQAYRESFGGWEEEDDFPVADDSEPASALEYDEP